MLNLLIFQYKKQNDFPILFRMTWRLWNNQILPPVQSLRKSILGRELVTL